MFLLHGKRVSQKEFRLAWLQDRIENLCAERDEAQIEIVYRQDCQHPGDTRDTADELISLNDEMIHQLENWYEREAMNGY